MHEVTLSRGLRSIANLLHIIIIIIFKYKNVWIVILVLINNWEMPLKESIGIGIEYRV